MISKNPSVYDKIKRRRDEYKYLPGKTYKAIEFWKDVLEDGHNDFDKEEIINYIEKFKIIYKDMAPCGKHINLVMNIIKEGKRFNRIFVMCKFKIKI